MVNEFILFHHKKYQKSSRSSSKFIGEEQCLANLDVIQFSERRDSSFSCPVLNFETCLRKIQISKVVQPNLIPEQNFYSQDWKLLQGEEAYGFLVEVLAGLHSPMIGETEVLGQFKNQIQNQQDSVIQFNPWISWIFEDIKKVRSQCLQNTGSQTYGSWVRALFPRVRPVFILGSGQLCEKIVPYMTSSSHPLGVVCRNKKKVKNNLLPYSLEYDDSVDELILNKKNKVNTNVNENLNSDFVTNFKSNSKPLSNSNSNSNSSFESSSNLISNDKSIDLIIASPISDNDIKKWIQINQLRICNYLDLRGESEPIENLIQTGFKMGLKDFFKMQEQQKFQIEHRKKEAIDLIHKMAHQRFEYCFHRPWGWDDVCSL